MEPFYAPRLQELPSLRTLKITVWCAPLSQTVRFSITKSPRIRAEGWEESAQRPKEGGRQWQAASVRDSPHAHQISKALGHHPALSMHIGGGHRSLGQGNGGQFREGPKEWRCVMVDLPMQNSSRHSLSNWLAWLG